MRTNKIKTIWIEAIYSLQKSNVPKLSQSCLPFLGGYTNIAEIM